LGFQKAGSHYLVEIEECHLPMPEIGAAWLAAQFDAIPGLERIEFRQGSDGEVLVCLEGSPDTLPVLELDAPYSLVHITQGGSVVLAGDDHVVYEVLDKSFRVSAGGFFQVNLPVAEAMSNHLLAELPVTPQTTLLDVYCGVGLFSKIFAPLVAKVTGIELDATACQDYATNLDEFDNVILYQGKAGQALAELKGKFDIVILDPPRAGLEPFALDTLLKLRPTHIAYVSCDPATLSRDLKHLLAGGYQMRKVTPFDLFPQTYHLESISLLENNSG
jgi:23S rRNA (uracil1939-C5)-methyltransferase